MDIKQLNYFRAIVEQGGISAAARSLGVAQPALSRALQSLESGLGEQLLQRSKSGITLTSHGLLFNEKVKKLIADFEALQEDPFDRKQRDFTKLKYGRSRYWISWPLAAFHDAVRDVNDVKIDSSIMVDQDHGMRQLLCGEIDVLLTHDRKWELSGVTMLCSGSFRWALYLNEQQFPEGSRVEVESIDWLAWSERNDSLFHRLETEVPGLSIRFSAGLEDLMAQSSYSQGLILPERLNLAPPTFRLHKTLEIPLVLCAYVRGDLFSTPAIQALKKGLEARW